MKAMVNPNECIGCAMCVQTCPKVFKIVDDKSFAYENPVPAGEEDACQQAADECPASAITIEK